MTDPSRQQKRHVAPRPCKLCGGQMLAWSPTQAEEQIYCSVKCRAQDKRKSCGRQCNICKVYQPLDNFNKTESGAYRRSCQGCNLPYIPRAHKGLNRSPNPCPHCGKHWHAKMPPSQFKNRKYCSRQCQGFATRVVPKRCNRCHRELPHDAYGLQPSGKVRRACCTECWSNSRARRANYHYFRPPPEELFRTAKRLGDKSGLATTLTRGQVRRIYNGPCAGCGGLVGHLVKKMQSEPMQTGNARGLCRPCWLMTKLMPFDVMVKHARDIAAKNPRGEP